MSVPAMKAVIEPGGESPRFERIKQTLLSSKVHLCPERAELITTFFKKHDNRREPMVVRRSRALGYLLEHKAIRIYPEELIVGNMGTRRISAIMQPELASVFMSEELLWIDKRATTPFEMPWRERLRLLLSVHPYWLVRNMALKAFFPRFHTMARYVAEQLNATYYLINEAGGIGHFLPNYEKVLKLGLRGYLAALEGKDGDFHRAACIACEALAAYAGRVAATAQALSEKERDPRRAAELQEIARICRKVPMDPPETLHEALQALWLTHMAVNMEGLNSAISFGRIDQYLYPYYQADLDAGRITPDEARELLLLFSAKAVEHVFLLSERTSQYHGGYLVVQAAIIGGMDKEGQDATNALTYLFLDVMEQLGLRDPNYQARIHRDSPPDYLQRVVDVARHGGGMPALFGDEAAIAALVSHGYPLQEARNYAVVGCVELSLPGKSFFSTDAGLFNLPLCLELALNRGKRFGKRRRLGAKTPDPANFKCIEQVIEAFRCQVDFMVARMIADLKVMEQGNRDYHPTPFSSLLVDGCLETGKDVTAGGAVYNSSGVQGVGIADVADSLAALQEVVFKHKKYSLATLIEALKNNFEGQEMLRAELLKSPKFGNDQPLPDAYADLAAHIYHDALAKHRNIRGGGYVPGFYSVTCHVAFGKRSPALPSGREAGEPFASSLGPCNGSDRRGPTALLNSVAHVDSKLAMNGYALNLRFDPETLAGEKGVTVLSALVEGFFSQGGMEMQLNVLDPEKLEDARTHPGKYPGLVVRVAGYCAYFDDLPDATKEEIIARTRLRA
ncbi:MAG: pyruvate formate lyase family protein [Syntrophaceae bacterium]